MNHPLVKKVYHRVFDKYDRRLEALEQQSRRLAKSNIDLRLQVKALRGEPIHVVFVCHRPAVWSSLRSVYEAMKRDEHFRVTVVTIPNKKPLPKLGLNHQVYEDEGAAEFWKDCGCVTGYDGETGRWLDLQSLQPDYVFFQQPYNITRAQAYQSKIVAQYARICYVAYYGITEIGEIFDDCNPLDFMEDVDWYFTQNQVDTPYLVERFARHGLDTQVCLTGFPSYDNLAACQTAESPLWLPREQERFRAIWTPRWTTNEGNCHFFAYKDNLLDYCRRSGDMDFVFRPHPQAFSEWSATGELTEQQAEAYCRRYDEAEYLHIDRAAGYMDLFFSSDCLISDRSSVMVDYFLTGKPIIYCVSGPNCDMAADLMEGLYPVHNWEELVNVLEKLKGGEDPLREKRREIAEKYFYFPAEGAGERIKNIIRRDAHQE